MKRIEQLLRERIGLDVTSLGPSVLARFIRLRMKQLHLDDPAQYLRRLTSSADEWQQLVEAVVVKETWFFRDAGAFAALVRVVHSEWLPRHPTRRLRLLSLPCSTGEEPYSLAMALLDARFPPERLEIEAVDLSEPALARAAEGLYGRNSFRGKDLAFRDRWFQKHKAGYEITPRLRHCVRFRAGNLLTLDPAALGGPYDYVFCRNLLIYFDAPTQAQALQRLREVVAEDGLLFVGPAEQPLVRHHGFVPENVPLAFASRPPGKAGGPRLDDHRPAVSFRSSASNTAPPVCPPVTGAGADSQPATEEPEPALANLAVAQRLADAGRFEEATVHCDAHLRQHGPTAQAYYLLGLVRDAHGDPAAWDYYRKALYLAPDHYEALLHVALWLEKNGEKERARPFRRRAERARNPKSGAESSESEIQPSKPPLHNAPAAS